MTNQRRRFTKRQKIDLYLASGGLCEICQQPLPPVFHADHIKPYSKGGITDVINGQATCPKCNLRKGDKEMRDFKNTFPLPEEFVPRIWQSEFFDSYTRKCISGGDSNFLLQACPAAGKTLASCAIANALLQMELINWVIVIVPTDHLRNQFAKDALVFKLELDHSAKHLPENLTNSGDYQGEVLTYAQMGSSHELYRIRCSRKNGKVLVIGDEIHHLSDDNSWGNAFQESFKEVKYRLFTSGTPFRSDKQKILSDWISYKDGYATPDYQYDYAKALKDGVVRNVIFPSYDGKFTWMRGYDGSILEKSFAETETKEEESEALKTALLPDGGWMEKTLASAHQQLLNIREWEHKNAGGLLVCMSKDYAEKSAKTLEKITGEKPIVVHSDDTESSEKIKGFAEAKGSNASKWIVAVKMISEGVSIKRLRVAVYATNILTLMFFLQLMGRITRIIGDYQDETAYFYVPSHPTLSEYVKDIESVVSEWEKADDDFEKTDKGNRQNKGLEDLPLFSSIPLASTGYEDAQYSGGDKILPEELEEARRLKSVAKIPKYFHDAHIAQILRAANPNKEHINENTDEKKSSKSNTTTTERCQKLKSAIQKKVCHLAILCGANDNNRPQIIKWIHSQANEITIKGKKQDKATEQELKNKLQLISSKIAWKKEHPSEELRW
jgi:superfamily II DNA or RNA helicase